MQETAEVFGEDSTKVEKSKIIKNIKKTEMSGFAKSVFAVAIVCLVFVLAGASGTGPEAGRPVAHAAPAVIGIVIFGLFVLLGGRE